MDAKAREAGGEGATLGSGTGIGFLQAFGGDRTTSTLFLQGP